MTSKILLLISILIALLFFHPQTLHAAGESPQSVTVSVYYDYNNNGVQDTGEPNVAGYSISVKTYRCTTTCPIDDGSQPAPITTTTSTITFNNLSENRIIDVILPQAAAAANGLKFYNSTSLQRRNGGAGASYTTYTINPDGNPSFSSTNTKHTNALLALGTSGNLDNANWFVKFALRPLNLMSVSCSPNGGQVIGNSITWNSNVSGGVTPYSYQWSFDGGNFSPNPSSVTVNYTTGFNKSGQVKVTDTYGFSATSGVCNVDLIIPPPAPSITQPGCIANTGVSGSEFDFTYLNNDVPVTRIDIGLDSNFTSYYSKSVTGSANTWVSTPAPNGFSGSFGVTGALTIYPKTTYYVRLYNGALSNPVSFGQNVSPCPDLTTWVLSPLTNPRASRPTTLSGTITNQIMDSSADASTARFCILGVNDTTTDPNCLNSITYLFSDLPVGTFTNSGSQNITSSSWTPAQQGIYRVYLCADVTKIIIESDETNNCQYLDITVDPAVLPWIKVINGGIHTNQRLNAIGGP
ncbi:hypothetical protein HYS93_00245 [Candidatus Daviesbacteria bacterium]|nr:hypothetical protein [Candidatus Daviesbacteria bacterium]